jgi:hypothetical protein
MTRTRNSHREACGDRRFTMADAIDVLANEAKFGSADRATVWIRQLQLPSRTIVGLVKVVFEEPASGKAFRVEMPTATGFTAIVARTNRREHFPIERLDEACVCESGQVTLRDGTAIRAVVLAPAQLTHECAQNVINLIRSSFY